MSSPGTDVRFYNGVWPCIFMTLVRAPVSYARANDSIIAYCRISLLIPRTRCTRRKHGKRVSFSPRYSSLSGRCRVSIYRSKPVRVRAATTRGVLSHTAATTRGFLSYTAANVRHERYDFRRFPMIIFFKSFPLIRYAFEEAIP